ncbi:MAG: hypothetical protein KC549_01550 [Myxococcales bacterium]|nr:hypothetical protein [Myxococcales bacterium]
MRLAACLALLLAGCGGTPTLPDEDEGALPPDTLGREDVVGDPEDTPEEVATRRPPGQAPRLRAPLPDGWPREPVEPLPIGGKSKTLLDHADPIARYVADLGAPGTLTVTITLAGARDFKARAVLYDSYGTTLQAEELAGPATFGPRQMLPGTVYLLVERRAGAAEVQVQGAFEAEAPVHE